MKDLEMTKNKKIATMQKEMMAMENKIKELEKAGPGGKKGSEAKVKELESMVAISQPFFFLADAQGQ
jgi:hypothetical protein